MIKKKIRILIELKNCVLIALFTPFILLSCNHAKSQNTSHSNLKETSKIYESKQKKAVGKMKDGLRNGVWRFYNKQGNLDSVIQYSEGKEQFHLNKSDFIFKVEQINSKNINITINVPKDWNTKTKINEDLILTSVKKCGKDIAFCPNIVLTKTPLSGNEQFTGFMKKRYKQIKSRFSFFKPIAQGNLSIDNYPTYQLTFIMVKNNVQLAGIVTWIYDKKMALYILLTELLSIRKIIAF